MASALRAPAAASMLVGWRVRSPSHRSLWVAGAVFAALTALGGSGVDLGAGPATTLACLAILLFGLPHGTLDMRDLGGARGPALLACYLAAAMAMAAAWAVAPLLALGLFYTIAIAHFADDWAGELEPFFAHALAVALLAAPAVLHLAQLRDLFERLAPGGALLADALLTVAPVALLVGLVATATLWRTRPRAVAEALLGIAAMLLLPPVIGFALFFTLIHSPRHLRELVAGRATVGLGTVALLTLAALGLTAALWLALPRLPVSEGLYRSSFMILSILTLPHLLLPVFRRFVPSP